MQRAHGMLWQFGVVTFLGMSLVSLMIPWPAQAGGLHVSVGLGIPVPVVVAPAPVYVQPAPVYVQPAPVYVQPAPVYVQPAPVVVTEPYPTPVYGLPPGIAKKYYGGYYRQGWYHRAKHWHHGHDD